MKEDDRQLGDLLGDAEWVRSRKEQPRIEAEDLMAALSILVGENPERVLEALHKDEPLARTVRKLLALDRQRVNTGGRPRETDKHLTELATLVALEVEGFKGRAKYDEARARLGYAPGCGPDDNTLRKNRTRVLAEFGGPNGIAKLMVHIFAARRKEDKT